MSDGDWRWLAVVALIAAVMFWAAYELLRLRIMIAGVQLEGRVMQADLATVLVAVNDNAEPAEPMETMQ